MCQDHPLYPNVLAFPADTIGLAYEILAKHPEFTLPAELADAVKTANRRCQHGRFKTASLADSTIERRLRMQKRQPAVYALPAPRAVLVVRAWDLLGANLAALLCEGYTLAQASHHAGIKVGTLKMRVSRARKKIAAAVTF